MVFPLFDDNSDRRRFPWVNYAFIAANIFVFIVLQEAGADRNKFTYAWSTVPAEIVTGKDIDETGQQPRTIEHPITKERIEIPPLQPTPISVYLTLLTSMFMHGSWAHLGGNMLFLWIFGDNVEDYLGHLRYIAFYVVCGILASLSHVGVSYFLQRDLAVPSLGASGAISGVLGGYLLLFPHRQVTVILFRFLTQVPAYVAIGIWFLFQIINSLGMFGGSGGGGVAYGAHIGGFIAGLGLVKFFAIGEHEPGWYRKLDQQSKRSGVRQPPW
jgi:membrane associated rhomboid family serine protease